MTDKKTSKKKRVILVILFVFVLFILWLLERTDSIVSIEVHESDPNDVVDFSDGSFKASAYSDGFVFNDGNLVKYYDISDKKTYVLCSKPNCLHNNSKCDAYFPDNYLSESSLEGVGGMEGYIYIKYTGAAETFNRDKTECLQILKMNPNNGSRSVIWEAPEIVYSNPGDDRKYINTVPVMYLCNNYIWIIDAQMSTPGKTWEDDWTEWRENIGIDLNTGNEIILGKLNDEVKISTFAAGMVTYYRTDYDMSVLIEKDFYEELSENGSVVANNKEYMDYQMYIADINAVNSFSRQYFLYDLSKNEEMALFECRSVPVERYSHITQYPSRQIIGAHNDILLIQELISDENGKCSFNDFKLSLYNINTRTEKDLMEVYNGHMPRSMSEGLNGILSDGTVFIYKYNEDGSRTEMWTYNIETGNTKYNYTEQDIGYIFRPERVYKGGYLGKKYELNGRAEGWNEHKDGSLPMRYYWISKDDFSCGNFSNMIRYDIK